MSRFSMPEGNEPPLLASTFAVSRPNWPLRAVVAVLLFGSVFLVVRLATNVQAPDESAPVTNGHRFGGRAQGEVFIVTRGGSSVRLALVQIEVHDAELLAKIIESRRATAEKEIADLQAPLKAAEEAVASSPRGEPRMAALLDLAKLQDKQVWAQAASNYFDLFPPPLLTTKTDADGRFQFALHIDRPLAVVAKAQRSVGESIERYFWVVRVPSSGKINLTNDNLTDTVSAESMLFAHAQ